MHTHADGNGHHDHDHHDHDGHEPVTTVTTVTHRWFTAQTGTAR